MKSKSPELMQINGDASIAATVIKHNGEILMLDRDRVARWQSWWAGCNK